LLNVLKPHAFLYSGVGIKQLSSSMPLSLKKLTFEDVAVFHVLLTPALLQVAHELPLIGIASVRNHLSVSTGCVVDELSLVDISVGKD
jgi:hypothetical protein